MFLSRVTLNKLDSSQPSILISNFFCAYSYVLLL
jgi:hypothetical protein